MKRKIDPNKVYAFIGRAVVILSANAIFAGMMVFGFLQNSIY